MIILQGARAQVLPCSAARVCARGRKVPLTEEVLVILPNSGFLCLADMQMLDAGKYVKQTNYYHVIAGCATKSF